MSDSTRANADSISEFGMQTVEQTASLGDGFGTHANGVMGANVGASNIDMAAYFQGSYANHAEALGAFIGEAGDGLMALGYAGVTVAQNYREGDADQQARMDDVNAAFDPADGTRSLKSDRAAAQQAAQDAGPATEGTPTTWAPPAPTGPMVCTPYGNVPASSDDGEPTPFEEVADLDDELGDAENEFVASEKTEETRENVEDMDDADVVAPGLPASSPTPATA